MPTVIDKLIVTLGLDTKPYEKDEAAALNKTKVTGERVTTEQKKQDTNREKVDRRTQKRIKETGDLNKKIADSTVKGFKDMAIGAGAFFLGFQSLKGFVSLLGNLNNNEADVGRLGKNLAIDPATLNTWGIAATYIGGKAEDVQASLAMVSASITALKVRGERSPLFELAQRFGIDVLHIKDKTEFLLTLGDKLREYGKKFGRDSAFNISGLDATTFNLITAEDSRAKLAKAAAANAYSDKTAAEAAKNQEKLEHVKAIGKKLAADLGHVVMPKATAFLETASEIADDMARGVGDALTGDFHGAWLKLKSSLTDPTVPGVDDVADANTSRGIANNNPGNIRAVGNQARDDKGFRKFGSMLEGLSAMDSQLDRYANRGIKTIRKIVETYAPASDGNDVPAYIKALEKATGRGADEELGKSDRSNLLRGIQLHETGKSAKVQAAFRQVGIAATPALNRASVTGKIDRSGGNQTNVSVGSVTVNTKGTDAPSIARDFAGSLKRQTYAAQANTGQT